MSVWTSRKPVDANAARELRNAPRRQTTAVCPPLCKVPVEEILRRNPGKSFSDMTGLRVGRLEVVGLFQWRGNRGSEWIVRCDCGMFERMNHNVLKFMHTKQRVLSCHACAPAAPSTDP